MPAQPPSHSSCHLPTLSLSHHSFLHLHCCCHLERQQTRLLAWNQVCCLSWWWRQWRLQEKGGRGQREREGQGGISPRHKPEKPTVKQFVFHGVSESSWFVGSHEPRIIMNHQFSSSCPFLSILMFMHMNTEVRSAVAARLYCCLC